MLKVYEEHMTATRSDKASDIYQTLDLVREIGLDRKHIRFKLMETRWRSPAEAADYLEWAAEEIRRLK